MPLPVFEVAASSDKAGYDVTLYIRAIDINDAKIIAREALDIHVRGGGFDDWKIGVAHYAEN